MQILELLKKHSIRQHVQIVPTPSDREVVLDAQRRLLEDPGDADALFAVAAWDEIVGDLLDALDVLNRLVSQTPDYPGVWWLRARVLKDLGRERDAIACEQIARMYAEPDIPQSVRQFPFDAPT
ncbi:MAG TPA: hypothetical protein VK189_05180 [Thermoplasmata archaeon]|nr:hypothetical protein [Thermoplasmata archaeon]